MGVADSGLMTYAGHMARFRRLLNGEVGRIDTLQDLRFELVINLKTAKALGLTVLQSLLLRANEVIQ